MPASHFDVKPMTGRPKFIVRHSTQTKLYNSCYIIFTLFCIAPIVYFMAEKQMLKGD
jgi:hypothetical protein